MMVAGADITSVPPSFSRPLHRPPSATDPQFHPYRFHGAASPHCAPRILRLLNSCSARLLPSFRAPTPSPLFPRPSAPGPARHPSPGRPTSPDVSQRCPSSERCRRGPWGTAWRGGAARTDLRTVPLLPGPLGGSASLSSSLALLSQLSCLSWPLPQSLCLSAVTAGQEISPLDGEGSERFLPPHLA